MDELKGKRALVVAQGELAQCPRMLNHARELARAGAEVHLLGYAGLPLPADIAGHASIVLRGISGLGTRRWRALPRALYFAAAALRACWIAAHLARRALTAPRCDLVVVQTPPAVPSLMVAWLAARLKGARLVVDWHNLSGAMLGLRLGADHALVRLLDDIELRLGRRADAHFCVSRAFAEALRARAIHAEVLPDAPREIAAPAQGEERAAILRRALPALGIEPQEGEAVIVSPTSWSLDEDMGLLLDALGAYAAQPNARACLLIATGVGPGRAAFEARAQGTATAKLRIATGWLDEPLYRDLLRAADLGVSTHRSASGLDLPIKLADMAAAGLPALAYDDGACPGEGVDVAARFANARELTAHLSRLLAAPPRAPVPPAIWGEEWRRVALPVLSR